MELQKLIENRAGLWSKMKDFLTNAKTENGVMNAGDMETYTKMEADLDNMGKQIDMLNRQADLEAKLKAPTTEPIKGTPGAGAKAKAGRASNEYNEAYWKYCKSRGTNFEVINALEIGTDSEGGFLVPESWESSVIEIMSGMSAMRPLAKIITTESDRNIPIVSAKGIAYWVDEEGDSTPSDDTFGNVTLSAHKIMAKTLVSNELLDDAVFDIEGYLKKEFARRTSTLEDTAFFTGDGSGKPTGILHSTGGAETGVTTAAALAITDDEILDLFFSLKPEYRKTANWMLNDATVKVIRKLKDGNDNYIWQPGLGAGSPDTMLGRPVVTSSAMPTIAASKKIIAFGDFSYYWIGDRLKMTMQKLVEKYAENGQTCFLSTSRVDGKLTLGEAVKVMLTHA
jgi:HK97 family phage major capsid protein